MLKVWQVTQAKNPNAPDRSHILSTDRLHPSAFLLKPSSKIKIVAISAHHANHPNSTRQPHPNRYLQPE